MEFLGYVAAVVMGLALGLVGGGGSILTVPIMVYLFNIDPVLATAYSLFIVGLTSAVGSFSHFKKGNVDLKMAMIFGVPSVIAVFSVRKFVLPALPDPIFTWFDQPVSKSLAVLILFALLMLVASYSMIKNPRVRVKQTTPEVSYRYFWIFAEGLIVGGITGLVGAGGGFLIIPALVLFAGVSMKKAVGTSLVIITLKSLIGFTGDLGAGLTIDYWFLIIFSVFAIVGIIIGSNLTKVVSNEKLKPAFGWFVMIMGILIIVKELFLPDFY